jgi:hypothetical protein
VNAIRSTAALRSGATASALPCVLLTVVLAGCAAERFEYHPATEIPEGPGMFTGKEGAVVLYRSDGTESSPAPARKAKGVPRSTSATADAAAGGPGDYREFREFQEFKRWKEANRNSPEYREFREWQEWKAFRAWKEKEHAR